MTVFDLAAAGAEGFRTWAMLEPLAQHCYCEIESAKDADIVPGYDTLNRAWLAAALLVLRGYTNQMCVACSSYSWNLIAGHQKRSKERLPKFEGHFLDFHIQLQLNSSAKSGSVSENDAAWVNGHFGAMSALASGNESFKFALESAVDWRYAKDSRASVARLWGGIEALFGVKTELVHRISIYCASLLTKRGPARTKKFHELKALYDLRSKAVHGAALSEEKLQAAVDESFNLLSALLLNTIILGHVPTSVDLDRVVFEE